MKLQLKNLLLATTTLVLSTSVFAMGAGFYAGGDFGRSNLHNPNQDIQLGPTSIPTYITTPADNKGIGVRFFMGANLNPYAAMEAGFVHYGSTSYGNVPTSVANNTPSIHEYGLDIDAKGMYPVGPVSIFGKVGFAYIRKSASGVLESCSASSSSGVTFPCSSSASVQNSTQSNSLRPLLGFGVSYDLSQSWQIDGSYTEVLKGSGINTATLMAIGFSYHVVDHYCGQFLCG
jgi:hypothetical protein